MSLAATCMNTSNNGILNEPPGIGSILVGPEIVQKLNMKTTAPASLRRTLSADMSSKKWMLQNGFSPLKRIASSEELQSEPVRDSWNNNSNQSEQQQQQQQKQQQEEPGQYDMWSSILSQKPSSLPPPYVHPLVKQSKSSLTGKSLEICTENLGSESGSDGFSSYSSSEISSDEEHDEEEEAEEEVVEESQTVDKEEMGTVHMNYSCSVSRKSLPRSFPPPLPSLSRPGLHIRPRREEGRLVLQAISLPTNNCFHAQRQDGRLLLTFIKSPSQTSMEVDEDDEEIHELANELQEEEEEEFEMEEDSETEEEEDEVEEGEEEGEPMIDRGFVLEVKVNQPTVPTGTINVHRSALMVNKLLGSLTNRNPTWSHKLEKLVELEETDPTLVIPQSLPSPPPRRAMPRLIPSPTPTTATSCFNTYEYSWRRKPASVTCGGAIHPLITTTKQSLAPINNYNTNTNFHNNNNNFLVPIKNSKAYQDQQQLVDVKHRSGEKGDFLIKSCKEPRRSLLSWEPYCIATS